MTEAEPVWSELTALIMVAGWAAVFDDDLPPAPIATPQPASPPPPPQ